MFSILAIPFYLVILKRRTRSFRHEDGVSCHNKVYFVLLTQKQTFDKLQSQQNKFLKIFFNVGFNNFYATQILREIKF